MVQGRCRSDSTSQEMKPLPSSELPLTQADLSETEAMFGYQPKVDLEQGIVQIQLIMIIE